MTTWAFIHVPRTGGGSIERQIGFGARPEAPRHASAVEVRDRVGAAWGQLFTFAFVRNPFVRIASLWAHQRSGQSGPAEKYERWLRDRAGRWQPARPMVDMLHDGAGHQVVFAVYRYEERDAALIEIASKIEQPLSPDGPRVHYSGMGRVTTCPHCAEVYMPEIAALYDGPVGQRCADFVREVYAKDFEEFGYSPHSPRFPI